MITLRWLSNHHLVGAHVARRMASLATSSMLFPAAFSMLLIGVTLSPITENFRDKPRDNFPLSYYPMFSKQRDGTATVSYLLGYDARGRSTPIPYSFAGTGGCNQVRKQIRKKVRRGDARELCRSIAKRLARKNTGPLASIQAVAVVTGTFRLDDFMAGRTKPQRLQIQAVCQVQRSS